MFTNCFPVTGILPDVADPQGDEVTVLQEADGGWWEVHCDGAHGWVPRSHLGPAPTGTR